MNKDNKNNDNQDSLKKKKLRVAFYIRVSKEDQAEMYWPNLQRNSLDWLLKWREYDLEFAWEEYVYKDLWKSWSKRTKDRPWLKRLFKDLKYWNDTFWQKVKPCDILSQMGIKCKKY